jgi:hypothetical protein
MSRSIVVPERSWPRRKKGKSRAVNVLIDLEADYVPCGSA